MRISNCSESKAYFRLRLIFSNFKSSVSLKFAFTILQLLTMSSGKIANNESTIINESKIVGMSSIVKGLFSFVTERSLFSFRLTTKLSMEKSRTK